jgi:hypothetical protein
MLLTDTVVEYVGVFDAVLLLALFSFTVLQSVHVCSA